MRDPLLSEALERLAVESATRFSTLVAGGDEVPFDVAEDAGEQSLFYRYQPLTARFVVERQAELRSLPAFAPARAVVIAADVAAAYLEARGVQVPADPDQRAERMLIAFIAGLWDGCGEFSLDRRRLEQALDRLDAQTRDIDEAEVLLAPIVGLQMPLTRLSLPSGVTIVRADMIEAPIEAMRSEGMNREAWEPQFLLVVDQGEVAEGSIEAMRQLRDLISVLRLFKQGGVGLGPYAFAPIGNGEWRRIATGAPATRPGGFRLSEAETNELGLFARRLEALPDPDGALRWAVARFEFGCERPTALEGLSDHLLALRAVLGGDGAVEAELHLRAAALAGGSGDRDEAKHHLRRALRLERRLMRAFEAEDDGDDAEAASGVAAWIEEAVRAILRDAALDELETDLRQATEGALIRAGLEAGGESDDQRGDGAEWDAVEEIRVTARQRIEVEEGKAPPEGEEEREMINRDWLSEVSRDATLEWPAAEDRLPPRERESIDTPRVRHLFPVPEDADWEVSELEYARRQSRVG